MTDFSNIQRQGNGASKTARYTFYEVKSEPWLEVVPATERNKPYFNALLKSQQRNRRTLRSGSITVDTIRRSRDEDRALYAKHIVKGWGNVQDAKGKAVGFSPDECADFLKALPDWLFDDLRNFASDLQSFDEEMDDAGEAGETAKN